jgi:hypothetical protein
MTILSFVCEEVNFEDFSSCPPELMWFCMRYLAAGVERLTFSGEPQDDQLLIALAASPAAATLRKIEFCGWMGPGVVTDESRGVWKQFPQLDNVSIPSSRITTLTLHELLAATPNIRILSLDTPRITGLEIVAALVNRGIELDELYLNSEGYMEIIHLLSENPQFAHKLRYLHFKWGSNREEDENLRIKVVDLIMEACPNLELFPTVFGVSHDSIALADLNTVGRGIRTLSVKGSGTVTQDDIVQLATRCQNLEDLTLTQVELQATDFGILSSLQTLSLEGLNGPIYNDLKLPPQLESLCINCPEGFFIGGERGLDSLLRRIVSVCPTLLYLNITTPYSVEKSTFVDVMHALPKLNGLRLTNSSATKRGTDVLPQSDYITVECYHPELSNLPSTEGMNLVSVPGHMPGWRFLKLNEPIKNHVKVEELPSRLPRVSTLVCEISDWDISFASRFPLLDHVKLSRKPALSRASFPKAAFDLHTIRRLSVTEIQLFEAEAATLVRKLPNLQTLRISWLPFDTAQMGSLNWIHEAPLLHQLELWNVNLLPGGPQLLEFCGRAFRLLTELRLHFVRLSALPEVISVHSMPNLRTCTILADSTAPLKIALADCRLLYDLRFSRLQLSGFSIIDLTGLDRLELSDCQIVLDYVTDESLRRRLLLEKFQFGPLPMLYHLKVVSQVTINEPEQQSRSSLLQEVENLIRAQAPKDV